MLAGQVNQGSQAELNRVKAPEPEPAAPQVDPLQFVDAELAVKGPRERKRREGFTFLQAGKLQREAEVMRLRVSDDGKPWGSAAREDRFVPWGSAPQRAYLEGR